MPVRHLLPIPLPHGRHGDVGRMTIYFSPRLRESGALSDYPEWADWGSFVRDRFAAGDIGALVDDQPVAVTPVGVAVEPTLWPIVFAADTPVRGHRPTRWDIHADDHLVPRSDFSDEILRLYAETAAQHPDVVPSGNDVLGLGSASVLGSPQAEEATAFVEPMEGDRLTEAVEPRWDFHQYVSILGHHPDLLRLLGIAVDVELKLPSSPGKVRVTVVNYDNGQRRRLVQFQMDTTPDFWMRSNPDLSEQVDGFLRLGGPSRTESGGYLSILDLESAADRLRGLDGRLPERSGALPGLRTRALTLVRPDLVTAYRNRTQRQWQIEHLIRQQLGAADPQPVELHAEDVEIGQRIDVVEPASGQPWRSLFDRRTDEDGYHFPRDPDQDRVPAADEGWATLTLVTELVEKGPDDHPDGDDPHVPTAPRRIDDHLYRWDGWSGAVRPPGRTMDPGTGGLLCKQPRTPPTGDPVQFAAHYEAVPGTLPRLRFGHAYRMRSRSVDLSGVSRALDAEAPAAAITGEQTFGRLEPIAAPHVVRRAPRPVPGVGDSSHTVVLLGDADTDAKLVVPQERLLFPGQVGQDLCELHGVPNGGAHPDSWTMLAERDALGPDDGWQTDPDTGEAVAEGPMRQPVDYLADPMAGRLRAHHHATGEERLATPTGAWPELTSSRVEVVAGTRSIEANPDDETELRISVAPADIDTVEISYAPVPGSIEQFGLWHQFEEDDTRAGLLDTIERGAHWMFSARTTLRLVHAVRRPLDAPVVRELQGQRAADSTAVHLEGAIGIERRSTGRVHLAARWTDLVDDPRTDGPEPRAGGAVLGDLDTPRLPSGPDEPFRIVRHRAELGDTRRHAATVDVEAFSYFRNHFAERRTVLLGLRPTLLDRQGVAAGSVKVRTKSGSVAIEGTDYRIDARAGTLTLVPGGLLAADDEVTVDYVALPVSRTSAEHDAPFEILFPATAAPPPPRVVEVVPAFARSADDAEPGKRIVDHDGGVVRVYLARPWNASGDGECLAVLVERPEATSSEATRLGRDPIVSGSTATLRAADLSRSFATVDADDGIHQLALHEVSYDRASRRWFADIAIQTSVYRPFVWLSLARHQPDAIAGQHRSPAVGLDPVRLGARRTVTVASTDRELHQVTVAGVDHAGMVADGAQLERATNELVVIHQVADPKIGDPDLRWNEEITRVALTRVNKGTRSEWTGSIRTPSSSQPSRLVVEEREPGFVGGKLPDRLDEVVHTEIIPLPV